MLAVLPINGKGHVGTLATTPEGYVSFIILAVENIGAEILIQGGSRLGGRMFHPSFHFIE